MDTRTLMNADYLDILFEKRNKKYGSYELRRGYGGRVGKAISILYSGLALLILLAVTNKHDVHATTTTDHGPIILTDIPPAPPPPAPPVTPPPPPPPSPRPATVRFTEPDITNDPVPESNTMATIDNLRDAIPGTITDTTGSDDINIATTSGDGKNRTVPVFTEPVPEKPLTIVEKMPEFNGDLLQYLSSHVHYPDVARNNGIEGRVVIRFVVDESGAVTEAQVLKGIGGGCDAEALSVVNGMPRWKPGKQNGRAVKVYYTIPVNFVLQ